MPTGKKINICLAENDPDYTFSIDGTDYAAREYSDLMRKGKYSEDVIGNKLLEAFNAAWEENN